MEFPPRLSPESADMASQRSASETPAALGYRWPAEWEPQEAVWLSWPHKRSTWPGQFRPIPAVFARIASEISRFQEVRINCAAPLQRRARAPGLATSAHPAREHRIELPLGGVACTHLLDEFIAGGISLRSAGEPHLCQKIETRIRDRVTRCHGSFPLSQS